MGLSAWSSAAYTIPLPAGHRFPIEKYALLRERVIASGLIPPERAADPPRATREELLRVHTARYVDAFTAGRLGAAAMRRIGFPWSPELVERSLRAVGGTVAATRAALERGLAINLAGGTHHAFPDHGEGFCVFNDVAVAVRTMFAEGRLARAAIIDLDVHQGNGTNAIFAADPTVFTFGMHAARNYPFTRVAGDLDVELADGTADEAYLAHLAGALPRVLAAARPDLVVYLAGADAHERDRLGRLALSLDGLARRDAMVLQGCREVGIPVAITIAGGYGHDITETVAAHANTVRIAATFAAADAATVPERALPA
jgi:acetoin utilization deacetylase AcuC-like enzyme